MKRLIWSAVILAMLLGASVFGYVARQEQITPLHSVMVKVNRVLRRAEGGPTLTERRTDRIETTFLRLNGTVYPMPNNDFVRGGALTVWGDDLLVMNRAGTIYLLDEASGLQATEITPPENGLAAYVSLSTTPDYADYLHKPSQFRFNDIEYIKTTDLHGLALSFTFFDPEQRCYGTRISWLPLAEDAGPETLKTAADEWQTVFDTYPCQPLNPDWTALDGLAAGGRLAFSAPSTLYLGSGDYHLDGIHTYDAGLQDPDSAFGKIMAIDLRTREARVFATGLRNTQGVAVDGQGRLWTTEHGLRGGDELNLVREDTNYGWPIETLGTLYSGLPVPGVPDYGRHTSFEPPIYAWLPSAAVSSLMVIDGFDPAWDGDLLAGSLSSEEFGQSLYRIRIRDERVVFVERIKLERRIRYLTQYGPDKIAVWLDSNELVIFTGSRRADPLERTRMALRATYDETLANQAIATLEACSQCHSFEQFEHGSAPSLNGLPGRKIAITSYTGYSDALRAKGGAWTDEALSAYLIDPESFASGTIMPAPGLEEGPLLDAVIWALKQANTEDDTHLTYN